MKTILITGAAGFIGANLAKRLLQENENMTVIGIDNMNDYYDVTIKEFRLKQIEETAALQQNNRWYFIKGNIADKALVDKVFMEYKPEVVVNLAAQPLFNIEFVCVA